ncbi:MAG: glycosyltransferase family A protein [Legionellales bacterium]|jgi:glycosyltransferase involved in cell wall biosynthesis
MYFSIIIPCYNAQNILGRTLDSILVQKAWVKEIILVDDGSQDQTKEVAQRYIQDNPTCPIHYHFQANQGPAKARNEGARLAQGDYTLFLDNDDALREGALETFHHYFAQNPEIKLLIAGSCDINGDRKKMCPPKPCKNALQMLTDYWFGELSIEGGAAPIRTEVLKTTHYPEKIRHGEDIVFFSHLLAQYPAKIIQEITLDGYRRPNSLRNQQTSILNDQDALTALLFDPQYLKPEYMAYKAQFHARNLITLARAALLLKQKDQSRAFLKQAFKSYPKSFLKIRTLKMYLKTYL